MCGALKAWRKNHPSLTQQESDCKIVINLLDLVEERRPLAPREARFRAIVVNILSRAMQAKLVMWKQRAKVKAAMGGTRTRVSSMRVLTNGAKETTSK